MLRKSLPAILFLALCAPPLSAVEESLVGTWEASGEEDGYSYTMRLVFRDDGTLEDSSVMRTEDGYWKLPQFQEGDDLSADEAEFLTRMWREAWPETPVDVSLMQRSGTYTTSGDSLRREWISADLRVDDRDFTEVMVPHWVQFTLNWEAALRAFEGSDFPEEDRLALEQELTILYHDFWTVEAMLAAMNEVPSTTFELRDGGEVLVFHGMPADALFFREADPQARPQAKPLTYLRIDAATQVAPATWGGVKSTLAP